uniref:C3H1-type domain-containing protein n=1 Tax=viral metagenome TaxID=1070528 RepID=A0A6C0K9B9_9ZZZZ
MSKVCLHYIAGRCRFGEECKKSHLENLCRNFFCWGKCERKNCNFSHDLPEGVEKPNPFASKPTERKPRTNRKNTESFEPSHAPADLLVHFNRRTAIGSNAISISDNVFQADLVYQPLSTEINKVKEADPEVFKLWHGDTHYIADDKKQWKMECPTFKRVVSEIAEHFGMEVKATRLNWYADGSEWKPYHHDAAAMKPDKAKTQNFTVGVSFGATRDISFQHSGAGKATVNFPLRDGMVYAFGKDVNIKWRHGIPQLPPGECDGPRISIVIWGWVEPNQ